MKKYDVHGHFRRSISSKLVHRYGYYESLDVPLHACGVKNENFHSKFSIRFDSFKQKRDFE